MLSNNKLIISIKEARKLLGKEHANMSDEEVVKLIEDLHFIAKHSLKKIAEDKHKQM